MFKEVDVSINVPSSVQRPMNNLDFERGILELVSMGQDLDTVNEHEKLFNDIRKVIADYFKKGE